MKKFLCFLSVMVCLMFTSACFAATAEEQLKEFKAKSEQGDAEAQFRLGSAYCQGNYGLSKDVVTGMEWLEKAGLQGHAKALNLLGNIYYHSLYAVPKDYAKAKEWYKLGCDQNWQESCDMLDKLK
jgi:FOG: TPR repeat, SEL1 subfamily